MWDPADMEVEKPPWEGLGLSSHGEHSNNFTRTHFNKEGCTKKGSHLRTLTPPQPIAAPSDKLASSTETNLLNTKTFILMVKY